MTAESKYFMALSYVKGLGIKSIKKLLDKVGTSAEIWNLSEKEKNSIPGLRKEIATQIGSSEILDLVAQELVFCQKNGINAYTLLDAGYPSMLKECVDAPPVLFIKGHVNLEYGKFISVVGTRKMTARGKDFVHSFIEELNQHTVSIVSGLATGIDAEAHKASLEHEMQTIGVLAHGLNQIYPKNHAKLATQMLENGGLVSEFSTFHGPAPENFLRRNRIIAGLCHATVVVESALAGGAMSTATHANNYNRDVFAVPGRVSDLTAAGCHHLIKNHKAFLITEAKDILKYLNLTPLKQKKKIQQELFVQLTAIEEEVYQLLNTHGKQHIDFIALQLGMPSYQLMPILLDLELKNLIEPLSGKFYDTL